MQRRERRPAILVEGFDPAAVVVDASTPKWVDIWGESASPPQMNKLPFPTDVLAGTALPAFEQLRLRDPKTFRCGNLHQFAHQWDTLMGDLPEYAVVRPWIHRGIHIPDFFEHFRGTFNTRVFDSDVPPPMLFQNDYQRCLDFKDFVTTTILQRVKEGSIKWVGRVGVDPPPKVVNALSVEPTKPRLINSMRAVNLFCRDCPFKLTPLSDIVRNVPQSSFFTGLDDTQGYKHLSLTEESYQYCGFEWGGHWFVDTTLPFGWKNSAYCYFTVGEILSKWLRAQGIYTELWIDDRFLGLAPKL